MEKMENEFASNSVLIYTKYLLIIFKESEDSNYEIIKEIVKD